jgi:hypothetical protein
MSTIPAPTKAAAPDVLPPAENPVAWGFSTTPYALLNELVDWHQFSQFVVPTTSAPASKAHVTTDASPFGVQGEIMDVPSIWGTLATDIQSLRQTVLPVNGPWIDESLIENVCAHAAPRT